MKDREIIDIASRQLAKISGFSRQHGEAQVEDTYFRLKGSCGCWFTTCSWVTFQICFKKPEDTYDTEPRVAHVEYAVCQRCGAIVDSKLSDQLESQDKN